MKSLNKQILNKIASASKELNINLNNEKLLEEVIEKSELKTLLDSLFKDFDDKTIDSELLIKIEDDNLLTIIYKYFDMYDYAVINEEDEVEIEEITLTEYTGDDIVKMYLSDIGKIPLYTKEEEIEAFKRVANGEEYVKKEIAEHNLRLVASIAKHYITYSMPFLDLISEGNLGLMKAVDKFDYTKGYKFSTYATWWIRQQITRSMADKSRTVRIPVHLHEKIIRINKVKSALTQTLGSEPTEEELAKATGFSVTTIRNCIKYDNFVVSYDTPVGEEEHGEVSTLLDYMSNETDSFNSTNATEALALQNSLNNTITEMLNQFTERERDVIIKRFGLYGVRERTLEEIGAEYNVTRERIRQIEAKVLSKLRKPSNSRKLKDFLD